MIRLRKKKQIKNHFDDFGTKLSDSRPQNPAPGYSVFSGLFSMNRQFSQNLFQIFFGKKNLKQILGKLIFFFCRKKSEAFRFQTPESGSGLLCFFRMFARCSFLCGPIWTKLGGNCSHHSPTRRYLPEDLQQR